MNGVGEAVTRTVEEAKRIPAFDQGNAILHQLGVIQATLQRQSNEIQQIRHPVQQVQQESRDNFACLNSQSSFIFTSLFSDSRDHNLLACLTNGTITRSDTSLCPLFDESGNYVEGFQVVNLRFPEELETEKSEVKMKED